MNYLLKEIKKNVKIRQNHKFKNKKVISDISTSFTIKKKLILKLSLPERICAIGKEIDRINLKIIKEPNEVLENVINVKLLRKRYVNLLKKLDFKHLGIYSLDRNK